MSAARQLPSIKSREHSRDQRATLLTLPGGRSQPTSAGNRIAAIRSPLLAKSNFGLVFLAVTILLVSLAGVLMLNTNVVTGSYEVSSLQSQIRAINQDVQIKQEELRRTQATLPARANELGLQPAQGAQVINIARYVSELTEQVIGAQSVRNLP